MNNTEKAKTNHLNKLREQVRLKHLGVKELNQKQQSGFYGLPSVYDYINTNTEETKK
jgi:hypothetical protein